MTDIRTRAWDATNFIHTAHLTVREDHIEAFRQRVSRHAEITRTEPGCLAFDVHQSTELPGVFFLFEVYRDSQSLEVHRASAHFQAFRRDVDGWVSARQWWYWAPVSLTQRDQGI